MAGWLVVRLTLILAPEGSSRLSQMYALVTLTAALRLDSFAVGGVWFPPSWSAAQQSLSTRRILSRPSARVLLRHVSDLTAGRTARGHTLLPFSQSVVPAAVRARLRQHTPGTFAPRDSYGA